MTAPAFTRMFRLVLLVALPTLLASHVASATCLPIVYNRYVGDTASDSQCTDNDIQSAIDNTTCPGTVIYASREHLYGNDGHCTSSANGGCHLSINNKSLSLVGQADGVGCGPPGACDPVLGCGGGPPPTQPLVTLDGDASNDFPVIYISNSNVTLKYLTITGAAAPGDGGGIHFEGTGSLTLDTSTISNNHAGYGAGINFNGTGDAGNIATLTLAANTLIANNHADTSGGGIRIEGNARLYALADGTSIVLNRADSGYGGGMEVLGPARADIGSPGYNGLAAVYGNTAANGGGVAVLGNVNGGLGLLRVFTTDRSRPTRIDGNIATTNGGGIYVGVAGGYRGIGCLYNAGVTGNVGEDGAAVYVAGGAEFAINADLPESPDCGPEPVASLGAVGCGDSPGCNDLSGSATQHGDGSPSAGAVLGVGAYAVLHADRLRMTDNLAAWMLRLDTEDSTGGNSSLSNCLIASNNASHDLVTGINGTELDVSDCTFANDVIDGGYAIANDYTTRLSDSIIDEPGSQALDVSGGALLDVNYVLANDISTLGGSPTAIQGEPTFVDAASGDYHLMPTSLGVDYAPAAAGFDLDGGTRDVDLPGVPNHDGPLDLGAYEIQLGCALGDTIFCNGFEGGR